MQHQEQYSSKYSQNAFWSGWVFLDPYNTSDPITGQLKMYKLVRSIYLKLELIHSKELSRNFYGLFLRSVKDTRLGKRRQSSLPVCLSRFTRCKTHMAGIAILCYARTAVLRPGWKARTVQKAKGRKSSYSPEGNIATKYRKGTVNSVSSSAFFIMLCGVS